MSTKVDFVPMQEGGNTHKQGYDRVNWTVCVSQFNPQSDKSEENIKSSVIKAGACVSQSARKTWINSVPSPGRLLQGDWQEATFYKMLQFGHIIHSTYCCWKTHKWYAAGHVKRRFAAWWDRSCREGGGGGESGESEVMDSPTSCRRKVWLMAVHSAKHTSCEGR